MKLSFKHSCFNFITKCLTVLCFILVNNIWKRIKKYLTFANLTKPYTHETLMHICTKNA